ncbi:MAG: phenylalanine--tRNA ligase subunit beta [Oscillospiraceae bacterium]|jgi:phenylalanyl-tRNA synthetase beta chain|nr:phenylalanine--tRNA ligase subunit beta [Oscillospiraceae bacterium]
MLLSLNWLNDFVKIEDDVKGFCQKMTFSGSKVESFSVLGEDIKDVVVGKIVSLAAHRDAQKLLVCEVDVNAEKKLQIVTGAQNVFAGALVPVALDGARLPGGVKIKKTKFRGIESCGMLCSRSELGLEVSSPAAEEGILIITEECKVGQNILEALMMKDEVVDFEITSNRPDCLSIIGLAREAAATYGLSFTEPVRDSRYISKNLETLKVEVEEETLCKRYMAKLVRGVDPSCCSPLWMQARLRAMGMRPISAVVDITNYVMLETGQPMHAFDSDKVSGKIIVRKAKQNEKLVTLDGISRQLDDSMLVIADDEKALAVAGVIGGLESGITKDTKNIIFESANFDQVSVQQTAKKLGIRTESSQRFEKGLSPFLCAEGLSRACELVEKLGVAAVDEFVVAFGVSDKKPVEVELDCDFINQLLGTDFSTDQIKEKLLRLGFGFSKDKGVVIVPWFRSDIQNNADLAEEVARIYDYNNIPSAPLIGTCNGVLTEMQKFEDQLVDLMISSGFCEVLTYTMTSPRHFERLMLGEDDAQRDCVIIRNPLGEDTSVMRTNTVPAMLELLASNQGKRNERALLFDLGCEYIKKEFKDENGKRLVDERPALTIGAYDLSGKEVDFYFIKGVIENLLERVGVRDYRFVKTDKLTYMHSGRTASVSVDGCDLGFLGELHPTVAESYGLQKGALVAKFDVRKMFESLTEKRYKQIPKYPAALRDIALICDENLPVFEIEQIIRGAAKDSLESLRLFDVYLGDQIPQGKKGVAYSLKFQSAKKTLEDEMVNKLVVKILRALEEKGIILR